MKVEFGTLVPCRECHGAGEVRHRASEQESRDRAREVARAKRQGETLDPVPSMDVCPVCRGKGYLPPSEADHR